MLLKNRELKDPKQSVYSVKLLTAFITRKAYMIKLTKIRSKQGMNTE